MSDLSPQLDPTHLAVVRQPAGWQASPNRSGEFSAVVTSQHEVTVVCPEEWLDEPDWSADALAVEIGWRRITFPGPLPWEQVGFLADVAGRLAAASIPFTSLSGFTTDHVLVRAAQADLAVDVLSGREPPEQRPVVNP